MEMSRKMRIHPLAAGAAVAFMIVSAEIAAAPPAPPSYAAQAAPVCPNCGVVASVNAYKQKPKRSVAGMVGGGVVGALVGSEIGNGSTLATVGGAAGGAFLGNEVGKKVQSTTRYKVVVRMDGGGTRSFTYAARPDFRAGSFVRVENGTLVHG